MLCKQSSDNLNLVKKAQSKKWINSKNIKYLLKFMAHLGLDENLHEEHFNPKRNSIEERFTYAQLWSNKS